MNTHPRFTVRSYRAFRTARLYRVFVAPEALYFIRMKGLISASDAGSGIHIDPLQAAVASLIRWIGRSTMEASREKVEQCDPKEMVQSSKKHFKVPAGDLVSSSLDPPSLLGGHGHYYALEGRCSRTQGGVPDRGCREPPDGAGRPPRCSDRG